MLRPEVYLPLLCFLFFFSSVHTIHITTSDFEEIYSGPGGKVDSDWISAEDAPVYSNEISVAEFLFTGTSKPEYYYSTVIEAFGPPKVDVLSGADVIDPRTFGVAADGYYFDGTSYWEELPKLSVYFNCKKDGDATLSLSVDVSTIITEDEEEISKNETVIFYFRKDCFNPHGRRIGFAIGKDAADDVVKHGTVQHKWLVESYYELYADPVVIPVSEHMSTFHVAISSPAYGNQYYEAPVVFVEDDDLVEVKIRGNAKNGGVATGMPESFVLVYDCEAEGDTEITVSMSLGFYGIIRFGFTKVCSVIDPQLHVESGLINVGISRSEYAGVVSNSVTSLFWALDSSSVEINHDEIATNFYVSTISGATQAILKPVISINPPNAFRITLSGSLRDGGVVTGSPQHFTINYLCDRVSEGEVTVTIKLPGFNTVEFAYLKKCKALKRHTDHIWTANQVMIVFILSVVGIVVASYIFYRKKIANRNPPSNRKSRP